MRRRDFLSAAAASAAALSLGSPGSWAAGPWRVATGLTERHPARTALQTFLPLHWVAPGAPAGAELMPLLPLAAGRPALAVLAALPFGPTPDRLVPWLLSVEGAAVWHQAAGPSLLPVWAAPGEAPRFTGSELFVLRLTDARDDGWSAAARQVLARAEQQPVLPVTASVARINEGNRAAERVERIAAEGDSLTRLCLSAMQALSLQCSSASCHHPLMELTA